jgi:hypothetical protein
MNRLLLSLSLFALAACGSKPGGPGGGGAGGGTGSTSKAWSRLLYSQKLTLDITTAWAGREPNPGEGMANATCTVAGKGTTHAEREAISTYPGAINNLGNTQGGDILGFLNIVDIGVVTSHSEETSSDCNPQMSNSWEPCLKDDTFAGMPFNLNLLASTARNPLEANVTGTALDAPVGGAAACAGLSSAETAIDWSTELLSTAEAFRDSTLPRPAEFKGTRAWKSGDVEGTLTWSLNFELVAKPPP